MSHRTLLLVVLALGAGAAVALPVIGRSPALPRSDYLPQDSERESRAAPGLDANQAARQAQARNGGGKVLAVEETSQGWRVKLLKDGTVRVVSVP